MSNTDSDYSELKKIETSLLANRTKANKDTNLGIIESSGIYGGQSNITENLKDVDESGKVSFGDTWLGDLLGFDEDGFGIKEGNPGFGASLGGKRREDDSASYRALEETAANKARENKEVEAAIAAASKAVTPQPSTNTSSNSVTGSGDYGQFSPVGGTDAGAGFSWEKKEGTNALTRKYTG
jgi:hypothetical protein